MPIPCAASTGGLHPCAGAVPYTAIKSRDQMVKVSVLALVFCLSIVLANLSLRFIPVSFNQARALPFDASSVASSLLCWSVSSLASSCQRGTAGHGGNVERPFSSQDVYRNLLPLLQAIGATTPAFTAICAFLIQRRTETLTVPHTLALLIARCSRAPAASVSC